MKSLIKKRPLVFFTIVTMLFSWGFRVPLGLKALGIIHVDVPRIFQFIGDLGPMIGAIITIILTDGVGKLKEMLKKGMAVKNRIGWLIIAAIFPFLVFFAGYLGDYYGNNGVSSIDLSLLGKWEEVPLSPIATAIFLFFFIGVGEEVGWRGYMLPKLQEKYSSIASIFISGVIWVIWHLPHFMYDENYSSWGPSRIISWIVFVFVMSIILTWLYNRTNGSILVAIIFHVSGDVVIGSLGADNEMVNISWAVSYLTLGFVLLVYEIIRNRRRKQCE